jgi:ACS family sodium-dependent inorganic phosphate cotransporter/ACS family sodium-dependent inorganic phosphate cotransporter-like MFS transporter 9
MAFLPWLVMAVGSSLSGVLADTLVSRGVPVTTVRKSLQTVAFLVPAVALLLLSQPGLAPQVILLQCLSKLNCLGVLHMCLMPLVSLCCLQTAVALMTVALGTTSLGQAGFVANMSDIAPKHAGMMFGLCNTFGSLSGIVGVTAVGFIVQYTGSFSPVFQMTAGLYIIGTLVWLLFATGEKVFD